MTSMAVRTKGRFPVHLRYEGEKKYAKGGLAKSAMAVKRAGRMGDTELVHVNKAEFEQLKQQYGEPTINPETGQPEFFLGFLKKLIAPILSIALPGLGTAIGGALGVGGTAGSLLGNAALGTLSGVAQGQPLGRAALGGVTGAVTGAAANAAGGVLGKNLGLSGAKPAIPQASVNPRLAAIGGSDGVFVNPNAIPAGSQSAVGSSSTLPGGAAPLQQPLPAPTPKPNFWNRDFLGIKGLPNKFGIPMSALLVAGLAKGNGDNADSGPPDQATIDKNLNPVFSSTAKLPAPTGSAAQLGSGNNSARRPIEDYYRAGSKPEYAYFDYVKHLAEGGPAGGHPLAVKGGAPSLAVQGPGTGRSDDIHAKLSDGEYVMDAETVALLGDGSNKAGADRLDALRVNLRKHKGRKLSRGKISPNAKAPEAYLRKGAR